MSLTMSPYITISEITNAASAISCTVDEAVAGIQKVAEVLSKLNISCFTSEGEFRNFGEVFQEAYDKIEDEKSQELLGPATLKETEKSNEKSDFDFLNQNVYDHIESIFDDYNDLYS